MPHQCQTHPQNMGKGESSLRKKGRSTQERNQGEEAKSEKKGGLGQESGKKKKESSEDRGGFRSGVASEGGACEFFNNAADPL